MPVKAVAGVGRNKMKVSNPVPLDVDEFDSNNDGDGFDDNDDNDDGGGDDSGWEPRTMKAEGVDLDSEPEPVSEEFKRAMMQMVVLPDEVFSVVKAMCDEFGGIDSGQLISIALTVLRHQIKHKGPKSIGAIVKEMQWDSKRASESVDRDMVNKLGEVK